MLIILLIAEVALATTARQNQVYSNTEQMPRFPGGEAALKKYINAHIQTPQNQECIDGKVILQFVVQSDGSIGEIKVVRSLHPDYDKEAIRVVKSLPKFTPGRKNGQAVAVWYTLPVTFSRQDYSDYDYSYTNHLNQDRDRDTTIYQSVEQMPRFPGGEAALIKYIKSHLQTPSTQESIAGIVILQFVVQSDGSIGDIKVVRSLHPDYDKEAARLIKSLPKFTPGRHNGQAVAVWYTLSITFY